MVKFHLSSVTLEHIFAFCKKKMGGGWEMYIAYTGLKLCPRLKFRHISAVKIFLFSLLIRIKQRRRKATKFIIVAVFCLWLGLGLAKTKNRRLLPAAVTVSISSFYHIKQITAVVIKFNNCIKENFRFVHFLKQFDFLRFIHFNPLLFNFLFCYVFD